jgi:hypothetical protein
MSTGMIDVCIGFQNAAYKTDIFSSAGRTDGRSFLMDFQENAGSFER